MIRPQEGIARPLPLAIVREIKRSGGLPVAELAVRLDMSYMGVKKHCLDLARAGYLATHRNPRPIGRPELTYSLTRKGEELFPTGAHALTLHLLNSAKELYGATAPGKLLLLFFRDQEKLYASRIRGESAHARAIWLIRIREREGHIAEIRGSDTDRSFQILERHHPMIDIFSEYPEAARMEADMIERLLGASVRCEIDGKAGASSIVFTAVPRPSFALTHG